MLINIATLSTRRLELIAQTAELIEMESMDQDRFLGVLDADLPDRWPPEFSNESAKSMLENLAFVPYCEGWFSWFFVLKQERILIGVGGFEGRPSVDGTIELSCSIVKGFRGKGYASEAVSALVSWAFSHRETSRVIAHTLPHLTASIRILEKNRFTLIGSRSEKGSMRFELSRKIFENGNADNR